MKTFFVLVVMTSATLSMLGQNATAPIAGQNWTPDSALIVKLESAIKAGKYPGMRSSHAIVPEEYDRYYTGYVEGGSRKIAAEFIRHFGQQSKPATIHIVATRKELPVVFDGGCSIINFVYNDNTDSVSPIRCNGVL